MLCAPGLGVAVGRQAASDGPAVQGPGRPPPGQDHQPAGDQPRPGVRVRVHRAARSSASPPSATTSRSWSRSGCWSVSSAASGPTTRWTATPSAAWPPPSTSKEPADDHRTDRPRRRPRPGPGPLCGRRHPGRRRPGRLWLRPAGRLRLRQRLLRRHRVRGARVRRPAVCRRRPRRPPRRGRAGQPGLRQPDRRGRAARGRDRPGPRLGRRDRRAPVAPGGSAPPARPTGWT